MSENLNIQEAKTWIYRRMLAELKGLNIGIVEQACNPNTLWGAYIRIDGKSYPNFIKAYWENLETPQQEDNSRLDPKILIVAPGSRLSLQYHHRRAEHWRVLNGPIKVIFGKDGDSLMEQIYQVGDVLRLPLGVWHRLVGMDTWGVVAEIWESLDPDNPSDEADIVRISDDFGRTKA